MPTVITPERLRRDEQARVDFPAGPAESATWHIGAPTTWADLQEAVAEIHKIDSGHREALQAELAQIDNAHAVAYAQYKAALAKTNRLAERADALRWRLANAEVSMAIDPEITQHYKLVQP